MQNNSKKLGPAEVNHLNDKQLLQEHFLLQKFLHQLESSSNMPTLPNDSLLIAIKKENEQLQENVEAFRNGKYEEYLHRKIQFLREELGKKYK